MAGLTQVSASTPSTSTANMSQSQSQTFQPSLPPPQTFDILPPLHELLARIDHISLPGEHSSSSEECDARYLELQPLEPKDLPGEVLPLKSKIRKALRELEKLPDMDRSVEDQREEIAELVLRKTKQEDMIRRLATVAEGMRIRLDRQ